MTVMRNDVVKALAKVNVQSNEQGLIPEYEVLVNLLPVALLNSLTERLLAAAPERKEEVEAGLVRAAYECGYHTGCGIITSEIFSEVVMPMVTEGEKDILRGAFAAFTAWGWAKSGIVQLKEGQRMIVRAFDYYEADSPGAGLRAYMLRGLNQAFFELAYADPYPDGMNTFVCKQTKGLEAGDSFGEFIVTRK
ncbi:MAG: hypothetical protein PHC98_08615 [Syntrophotalea acetylenica]|jgi:hypothetical protein|uniref:Uncharacterized protein n=1 Tax=Syntrophotalea acetylenica TaxID=29542 RepID=A0A1L3GGV0_SYNAC|nr:hypothetical protein [Syntrophotalea acetylenica]APG25119.1 hypothetical protein A7E75_08870 [Syntrophotalea acetylenica]APG43188.1 hypothetical protein A6070_02845 [Syntrophotalea acetylenica]MDD4457630.1 hypothetical protein [Syntrophotalea acetylenica]MDY0260885.1 hypothetical protein [Syntrophotalea acetylenica]